MGRLKVRNISMCFLIIVLLCCCSYLFGLNRVNATTDNKMFVLGEGATPIKYKIVSDNSISCNLATFSNIYHNMLSDGYLVESIECSEEQIDVVLVRDENQIRILYKKDGLLASIAKPYEKSYIPMTYISKEEIMQSE